MNQTDDETWGEIVGTAQEILSGHLDLVTGCRKLRRLTLDLTNPNQEIFGPIRGFESETDSYPLGEARRGYSQEYLDRVDRELADFSKRAGPSVLAACREIVADRGRL